jgi:hypothetical protein
MYIHICVGSRGRCCSRGAGTSATYPCEELLVSGEVDMCQATGTPALLLLSGVNRVQMITLAGLQEAQQQPFRHFKLISCLFNCFPAGIATRNIEGSTVWAAVLPSLGCMAGAAVQSPAAVCFGMALSSWHLLMCMPSILLHLLLCNQWLSVPTWGHRWPLHAGTPHSLQHCCWLLCLLHLGLLHNQNSVLMFQAAPSNWFVTIWWPCAGACTGLMALSRLLYQETCCTCC